MTPLSVIILAKNEENFISWCIGSVRWADEVLVVDSGSTDKTRELATSLGAKVYEQEWLGWSGQRNKGVSLAKNDWVFFIEADEIVSAELASSIQQAFTKTVDERDGYSLDRRGDFLGVLLPNEARASKRLNFVRIFNRKHSAYDMSMKVHEEVLFPGKAIPLDGVLLHWRGYTMNELVAVFNRYATVEAEVLNEKGKHATALDILGWPVLRFLWSYLAKGGWRLGTRGLMHAMLKGSSDYIRYAKLWELQNAPRTIHPPTHFYQPQNSKASTDQNLSVGSKVTTTPSSRKP